MKVVLDIGQFVSAVIAPQGHPAQILAAWREDQLELVTSPSILDDLRRVLGYPHIRKRHGWQNEEIDLFVDSLSLAASMVSGQIEVEAVPDDPTDDKIVACAVEAEADYIVASDEHLARLGSFSGIPIVAPRRFLEILSERGEDQKQ